MQFLPLKPFTLVLVVLSLILLLSGCKKPPVPEVSFMSPDIGKIGTTVRIEGKYLTYFHTLMVGGVEVDEVLFDTIENEKIVFRIPAEAPLGFAEVFFIHDRGETEPFLFENLGNGPQIKAVRPETVMPGSSIEIIGTALSNAEVGVTWGSLPLEEVSIVSDTLLKANIPVTATAGLDFITVTIGTCTSNREALTVTAPAQPAPTITAIDPMFVRVGDTVCITGQNFVPENTLVSFEPSIAASILSIDSAEIKVVVPPGSKTGPIKVQTTAEDPALSETISLLPKITDFDPKSGVSETIVNLTGWNFENLIQVSFNSAVAEVINTATDTTVTVEVPPLGVTGLIPLFLETAIGVSNEVEFLLTDVCDNLKPVISSINQNTVQPGDTLVIQGTNFLPDGIKVQFDNSTELSIISVMDSNQIKAVIPVEAQCILSNIRVTTTCDSSGTLPLSIEKTPIIDSLSSTMVEVGQSISLFGTFWNLTDYQLKLGNLDIPLAPNDILPDRIDFTIPEGAASGVLSLISSSCGNANSVAITIVASTPVISALSQNCAVVGDQFTILGQNFIPGESQVFIDGQLAAITSSTPQEIVVTVPEDVTLDMNVEVEVVNPVDDRSTPFNLFMIQLPEVSTFIPQRNPAKGVLILGGKNLGDVDRIRFGSNTYLTQTANQFIWLSAFDEIGLNIPETLPLGDTEVCLEINPCNEKVYEVCFMYEIINGTVSNPGPGVGGVTTIILPNPPIGSSLSSISNNWSLMVLNPEAEIPEVLNSGLNLIDVTGGDCSSATEGQLFEFFAESNEFPPDTIAKGVYSLTGDSISLNYLGKEYIGRQDNSFSANNPLNNEDNCQDNHLPFRVIFTPLESGDQLEMIFPYLLTAINPPSINSTLANEITLKGRLFADPISGNPNSDISVIVRGPLEGEVQIVPIPLTADNIDPTTLRFALQANQLAPGTYELSAQEGNQLKHSNVVLLQVN